MSGEVEVFLDDTPGEVRGIISRDGRFERLLIQRDDDPPQHRLGARSMGRVLSVEGAFGAAFVDIGGPQAAGFLKLGKGSPPSEGEWIEVEVVAEPRELKGPTLRRIGRGDGPVRLTRPGPTVAAQLAVLAPGIEVQTGAAAIQASWDVEEEVLGGGDFFAEMALDLAVQRTRALVAVDIDYAHLPGRDPRKGRADANRHGLREAARMIRLRNWGGLVVIDLVGAGLDGEAILRMARSAFAAEAEIVFGPLSRFGLLQLSLPWRHTPVEEVLRGWGGVRASARTEAIDLTRRLRHSVLSDTATPRFTARCAPEEAAAAAPLVAQLGPRAAVRADAAVAPGRCEIDEG